MGSFPMCIQRVCHALLFTSIAVGTAAAQVKGVSVPRFAQPFELVIVDSAESRPLPSRAHLRYPPSERARQHEAGFTAVFVVDTLGRVEWQSTSFLGTAPPLFREAVCTLLREQRFTPISRDGKLRRGLVVTDFTFSLGKGYERWAKNFTIAPSIRASIDREGIAQAILAIETQPHCEN
jgi:hypothetical protein